MLALTPDIRKSPPDCGLRGSSGINGVVSGRLAGPHQAQHDPPKINLKGKSQVSRPLGVKLMRSQVWTADTERSKVAWRAQPYVLKSGHIGGSAVLKWKCSSYQWFATTVRSVIERLRKRKVVSRRCKYKKWRHITMIAIIYVLTNNDSMLERLLHCRGVDFTRVFFHYINTVDDKIRFLYDQASKSALWFELRGNPRVQSTKKTIVEHYRNFSVKNFDTRRQRRELVDCLSDPWVVGTRGYCKGMTFLTSWAGIEGS